MAILTVQKNENEKFLRKATAPFDFSKYTKQEVRDLIAMMRAEMLRASGVGLAANQVGLDVSVFVAQANNKFYAAFNPRLEITSRESITDEEGCLSVPHMYGKTPRAVKVTLTGFDKNGKPIKIKAWGLLARIFQHEVDHLNGWLFIDKAKEVHKIMPRIS